MFTISFLALGNTKLLSKYNDLKQNIFWFTNLEFEMVTFADLNVLHHDCNKNNVHDTMYDLPFIYEYFSIMERARRNEF